MSDIQRKTAGNPKPRPSYFTPSLWHLAPDSPLTYEPVLDDPDANARAKAAVATGDPATLMLTLMQLVEEGRHVAAGIVARGALDAKQNQLPGISTRRLAYIAMAGLVKAGATVTADLAAVAAELRDSATFFDIAFGATSTRRNPADVQASLDTARRQVSAFADEIARAAAGDWTQGRNIIRGLSACGLVTLARSLADGATRFTGCSGLSVSVAASARHQYGAGRGLAMLYDILAVEPMNVAARTSACACLVDQGQPDEGLGHLAVALLQPDPYSAWAAIRALRVAGRYDLVPQARTLLDVCQGERSTVECGAKVLAGDLIAATGKRAMAELAIARYREAAGATFTFERRVAYDTGTQPTPLTVVTP